MEIKISKESKDPKEELKEIMDLENNLNLNKQSSDKPGRGGFIQLMIIITRVFNLLSALAAIYTTMDFYTTVSFKFYCYRPNSYSSEYLTTKSLVVKFPFTFEGQSLTVPISCKNNSGQETLRLDRYDFKEIALFYVGIGMVSGGYSFICLLIHLFGCRKIGTKILTTDKWLMHLLSIIWMVGTSVWWVDVNNIKHYAQPSYLISRLVFCNHDYDYRNRGQCYENSRGNFEFFDYSLISGLVSIVLWTVSIGLVSLRRRVLLQSDTDQSKPSTISNFGLFLRQEFREISDQGYTGFNLVKITLVSFYTLGIIASISLAGVAMDRVYGYQWQSQIVVIVFGLIYQIILSVVGVFGALKEHLNVMIVWTVMNVICIVVNGFIFSWISSILVAFTTILTAIYAIMIFHKNSLNTDSNPKELQESIIEK